MELDEALSRPTLPIPIAGRVFYNLGYNASYAAANRGVIPTVSTGPHRKQALVAAIAEQLGLPTNFGPSKSLQQD